MGLVEHINSNIDLYKLLVPIVATFIVSIIGLYISSSYNSKQIEINKRQNENNRRMAIIKEVSNLLPKLGSDNDNERKFAAMTLGFYDKETLPILKVLLFDSNSSIQISAAESLLMHDNQTSYTYLKETIINEWHIFSEKNKSKILTLLAKLRKNDAFEIIEKKLDEDENVPVKQAAIQSLIYDDKLKALSIAGKILANPNEEIAIRIEAAKILAHFRDESSMDVLKRNLEKSLYFFQNYQIPNNLDSPQRHHEERLISNNLILLGQITDAIIAISPAFDFSEGNAILVNFFSNNSDIIGVGFSFRSMFLKLINKCNRESPENTVTEMAKNPNSSVETKKSAQRIIEIFDQDTNSAYSWRGLK